MNRIKFRAVIKFLIKQGKTTQIILKEMLAVYKDCCAGKAKIYKLRSFYKQGREAI